MNDFFSSKGKMVALFSVIIILITGGAVFWAYNAINTGIDMDNLPEPEVIVQETEEEPEPEPEFNRPDKMRGIVVNPGLDFFESKDNDQETVESQIASILDKAREYDFNSIIINTSYKDGEEDKVIYHSPDAEKISIESEVEGESGVDIYNLIAKKATAEGFFVYALIDLKPYSYPIESLFTVDNYDDRHKTSDLYVNLEKFTETYQPDGIIATGYQNILSDEQLEEYKDAGGELSLEEYLVQGAELNLKTAKQAVSSVSIDIQFGILADPVWQNESESDKGSKTSSDTSALADYYVDTRSIITNDLVDMVFVNTDTEIGNEKTDFEEVADWWDSLSRETEAPIYMMLKASKVGASENPYGNKELAKQAEAIDKLHEIKGISVDGLSYFESNKESMKAFMDYYKSDEDPDDGEKPSEETPTTKPPEKTDSKNPQPSTSNPPATKPPEAHTPPPATSPETISLNTTQLNMLVGEDKQLTATITPKTASQEANWASGDRNVVRVDGNGKVVAHGKGTATISATSAGGKKAICTITVTDAKVSTPTTPGTVPGVGVSVSEVSLSKDSASVAIGSTYQFDYEVRPDNATNKNVTWGSSNTSVATVDTTGKVTGVAVGEATITLTSVDGQKTAKATIKVSDSDGTGPSLSTDDSTLKDSSSIEISGTGSNMYIKSSMTMVVKNQSGKALANSLFKWESSNRDILRVDNSGVVSSKTVAGTSTISAFNDKNDLYATYKITVSSERVKITAIDISPSDISVAVGKTNSSIKATLTPSNASASDLTWRVSNPSIASVDNNGVITGKAVGSTTLIARAGSGNVQSSCKITVTSQAEIYDLYIRDDDFEMFEGHTDSLTAIVDPSGADVNLVWSSSSPAVLEVDNKGNLTAKKPGTATITVKLADNDKFYDTVKITVT